MLLETRASFHVDQLVLVFYIMYIFTLCCVYYWNVAILLGISARFPTRIPCVYLQDLMVGTEASELRSSLEVSYPMDNGIVRNWDDMVHLYDYTFGPDRLNIDTTNSRILLTEAPMNPVKNRQRMVEVSHVFVTSLDGTGVM